MGRTAAPASDKNDTPLEFLQETASECTLTVIAGPVERLSVYSRPMPNDKGKVRTCIVPEDRLGNPSVLTNPIDAELVWEGSKRTIQLKETTIVDLDAPKDIGRCRVAIPMASLALDENIANGVRDDGKLVVTGNPVWAHNADRKYAAFGEFHWHSEISADGTRSIDDALRSAQDYLNMDYASIGDHNPQGDDWDRTIRALEKHNKPGFFATFFGWEISSTAGHENYYFTDPNHPLKCGGAAGIKNGNPDELVGKLSALYENCDFIAIPHHTNAISGTRREKDDTPYWFPYLWTKPQDYIRLIEIMQTRGNHEKEEYDDAWRGWHQKNNSSAQKALSLGYRIGFVGGSDNHCGWPGRAYSASESAGVHPPKSVILTGVWTDALERQAVYDALKQRHTWAVWDTRALVDFRVNNAMAGSEIELDKGDALNASIRLSAEDALQSVEIVCEGETVWAQSFDELDIDVNVDLGKAEKDTHFYLRALQRNGGIIYASPVFAFVSTR